MKKNKEWLKEEINYLKEAVGKPAINDFSRGLNDAYDTLESLIDQLDEPDLTGEYRKGYEQGVLNAIQTANESKKIEIPQFVADAIEKNKNKSLNIYGIIAEFAMDKRKKNWFIEVDGSLSYETLCRAWFDGYTIAPENKMQITIKSYDKTELEIELPESEAKKLIDQLKEVSE